MRFWLAIVRTQSICTNILVPCPNPNYGRPLCALTLALVGALVFDDYCYHRAWSFYCLGGQVICRVNKIRERNMRVYDCPSHPSNLTTTTAAATAATAALYPNCDQYSDVQVSDAYSRQHKAIDEGKKCYNSTTHMHKKQRSIRTHESKQAPTT